METSILMEILFVISLLVFFSTLFIIIPNIVVKHKPMIKSKVVQNDIEGTMKNRT